MNAIILAGGSGERLKPYTQDLPKGMLEVGGKTLIERQLDLYRGNGIEDITIATGFAAEKISYEDVNYVHNPNFKSTNMLETLMAARASLVGEVVVSYADLAFDRKVLQSICDNEADIGVAVDTTWQEYWRMRYDRLDYDIESLKFGSDGNIIEIGKPEDSPTDIDGRYIGLIKFSPVGSETFLSFYDRKRSEFWGKPWQTSKLFQRAYMTDMLQGLLDDGVRVDAVTVEGGWLEFDTVDDYMKFGVANSFSGNKEGGTPKSLLTRALGSVGIGYAFLELGSITGS